LGWDIRDPNEVELEYPTVDYALKINGKPVLLVEAKALGDMLDDVKAITQVVGYAANNGIVWCVLTNGVNWKVYRSMEQCEAPDKLMFQVSLDPRDPGGIPVQQLVGQLRRFSREEMAKGTLDVLGEKTFTDGKVRKALDAMMQSPPRPFVKLMRKAIGDSNLTPQQVKDSLVRIWAASGAAPVAPGQRLPPERISDTPSAIRHQAAVKAAETRRRKVEGPAYDESHHIAGKPQEVLELYHAVDRLCLSLRPGAVDKYFRSKSINYRREKHIFCCIHLFATDLRVWLKLKYGRLATPPPAFARDVPHAKHWGVGDLELRITNLAQLDEAANLIRQSYEENA
jgi:hypothetical protein